MASRARSNASDSKIVPKLRFERGLNQRVGSSAKTMMLLLIYERGGLTHQEILREIERIHKTFPCTITRHLAHLVQKRLIVRKDKIYLLSEHGRWLIFGVLEIPSDRI